MILTEKVREMALGDLHTVVIEGVKQFDTAKVFDCGQCFRFDPVSNTAHRVEFAGCAYGRYISIGQDGDTLYIYNSTLEEYEGIWKSFLGLDRNYDEINESILALSQNPALVDAVEKAGGIRILKQEPWEAICSFIISQNNNIPRIKKLVAAISAKCGTELDVSLMEGHIADAHKDHDGHFCSFPTPESILSLGISGLSELKTGFRAKYIYDAAEKMSKGEIDIDLLTSIPTEDAVKQLCLVKGIGPKVASCALLFGFARLDAFPIDVWIKKVMAKYFNEDFDPKALGHYAGIAQQYLFYYERYLQN